MIGFILVIIVDFLKSSFPTFHIEKPLQKGPRKFLKMAIRVVSPVRDLFKIVKKYIAPSIHSSSTLTIYINHKEKSQYKAKWDEAPEPLEYPHKIIKKVVFSGSYLEQNIQKNISITGDLSEDQDAYPRLDMIPDSMQTINLIPDDVSTCSILVKHKGETGFYIYDPEYYFEGLRQKNYCNYQKVYLLIRFKSSLGYWDDYYLVNNPDSELTNFSTMRISKEEYESLIK